LSKPHRVLILSTAETSTCTALWTLPQWPTVNNIGGSSYGIGQQ